MASQSGGLANHLVNGGMAAPLAKLVANAIANAASGQFSRGQDVVDSTPSMAMRLIDADARRYQFPTLDYSPDQPSQDALGPSTVQYADPTAPHPYQDAQPVTTTPPLAQKPVRGGAYINAVEAVANDAKETTVSLRLTTPSSQATTGAGTHLRVNPATNSIESVELRFLFPQGIVAASVSERESATEVTLSVPNQTLLEILSAYTRPVYQCRAWALFSAKRNTAGTDDTSTLPLTNRLIRNSGNVSSVQRMASGVYQVFFATPMNTNTYAVFITGSGEVIVGVRAITSNHTTTFCQVYLTNAAQTLVDNTPDYVHVAVFE